MKRKRGLLKIVGLLAGLLLLGCGAGTATSAPVAATVAATATPSAGLPAGCTILLRYQSGDRNSSPCTWTVCDDGRVTREGDTCPRDVAAPKSLSADQLAAIEQRLAASDFFALESYYPSPDGC